jgi:hypothetical protein
MDHKTYKQELEDGTATPELLDDLTDEWHEDSTLTMPLHRFLGFDTLEEYGEAVLPQNSQHSTE